MKEKRLVIMPHAYFFTAVLVLGICTWDVIFGGLLAPAVDITHGLGVAAVCVVCEIAQAVLMILIGIDLMKKITASTLQKGVLLLIVSLLTLVFSVWGNYLILPALFGMILPVVTLFIIR